MPAYAAFLQGQQQHAQHPQHQDQDARSPEARGSGAAPGPPRASSAPGAAPSWQDVPLSTKQNYFHTFPLPSRCVGGKAGGLGAADFVHCSSGSSGAPTLWARNVFDELAVCAR